MVRWCLVLAIGLAVLSFGAGPARAQIGPGEQIDLTNTLEKGLRVRLQRERLFVQRVVRLVGEGTLQRDMVLSLFYKARQRDNRHPFVYFREMMTIAAKQQGVVIPY